MILYCPTLYIYYYFGLCSGMGEAFAACHAQELIASLLQADAAEPQAQVDPNMNFEAWIFGPDDPEI